MRTVVASSIRARGLVLLLAALALVGGVVELRGAKVDSLPEFGPPTVDVRTEALGLSAPEVEQLITVPMEQDLLDGVGWLAAIHSASLPGLSAIELVFEPGTNLLRARQLVQERLAQTIVLPNVSQPAQMLQPQSSTSRVEMIGLSSKRLTPIQMSVLAWWTIRPRLLGVRGVSNVAIWGLRDRQLQVQVDPKRLASSGVRLQQVLDTTGNALWASPLTFLEANTPGTGGFIDTPNQRLSVQHQQPITKAKDLEQIPIEETTGKRLQDVASVVEDHQPLIGDALLPNGPGLLVVVEKSPGANTLDVTHGIEATLRTLRPGLRGMTVDPSVYRPASFIERSQRNLRTSVVAGFVLLLLALGLAFFALTEAAICVAAVLVSLLAAALVLVARGFTFDLVVFGGIFGAVAFVVIDQVSSVHHIAERLRESPDANAADVIAASFGEARTGVVFVGLIALVAAWPLLVLRGAAGAFFPPMVGAYLLGVGASIVVGTTFTPVACFFLLPRLSRTNHRAPERYVRTLTKILGRPRPVIAASVAVVLLAIVCVPFMSHRFLPSFRDAAILVEWNAAPGTSLGEMDRITTRAAHEMERLHGVRGVGAHIGRAVLSDETSGVEAAELWVDVDPSANYGATLARVREVADGYPGVSSHVVTYPNERLDSVFKEPTAPVVVRLFGQDPAVLHARAEQLGRGMAHIAGVVEPRVEEPVVEPTVHVEVNLAAAERHGIKPGDVRRAAATMFQGTAVGSLFEDQKIFDVVVWSVPEARRTLTNIRDLVIDTPSGGHVRVGDVADVRIAPTPTQIVHEEVSRKLDITADVKGRSLGAVLADVSQLLHQTKLPLEYHAELIRDAGTQRSAGDHLVVVAIGALIGLVLLLHGATRSWRLAAVLALTLPITVAGGLLASFALGRTLSIGAIAGVVAAVGVASYNGVTLFRRYGRLIADGARTGPALALRGATEQLRGVVAGAAVSLVFLLPTALARSLPGLEIVQPMAAVLLGAVVASALVSLLLLPALYLRFATATEGVEDRTHEIVGAG